MSCTNRFPPTKNVKYRSSWSPSSASVFNRSERSRPWSEVEDDPDIDRINWVQQSLLPLQEEVADWINKTISKFILLQLMTLVEMSFFTNDYIDQPLNWMQLFPNLD